MAEYARLARPKKRRWSKGSMFGNPFAARSSLWLGRDHLLNVDSTSYTESYRRFYFRDIQAITIQTNGRRGFWNVTLGILFVLYVALFAYFSGGTADDVTVIVGAMFAVVFFIAPLAWNNLLGPACVCTLRTAVQMEELPSLGRVWRARKVLARIRPLIAASQGELSREEIAAGIEGMAASANPPPPVAPPVLGPMAEDFPMPPEPSMPPGASDPPEATA